MSSSTYSPNINQSGQDSLTIIFFWAPIFRSGLEARWNKNNSTNRVSKKCRQQTADWRPGTKCRLGTECRLQTGHKIQTENLYCIFIWYVITCHLTSYRVSCNRFPRLSFTSICTIYWGIFFPRFFITIVLNIISSFHVVFSFCARVGWWDFGTEFTNLIKVDVDRDVKEISLLDI